MNWCAVAVQLCIDYVFMLCFCRLCLFIFANWMCVDKLCSSFVLTAHTDFGVILTDRRAFELPPLPKWMLYTVALRLLSRLLYLYRFHFYFTHKFHNKTTAIHFHIQIVYIDVVLRHSVQALVFIFCPLRRTNRYAIDCKSRYWYVGLSIER